MREEVAGGWRKIHNVELYDLFSSSRIIRVVTTNGGEECLHGFGMGT